LIFFPLNFCFILESEYEPIIQHHRHPIGGRNPQFLVKLGENQRAGGDASKKTSLNAMISEYQSSCECSSKNMKVTALHIIDDVLQGKAENTREKGINNYFVAYCGFYMLQYMPKEQYIYRSIPFHSLVHRVTRCFIPYAGNR
jgi:hypothetical protein